MSREGPERKTSQDDLALVHDRANRAKRPTSVDAPAALGENCSIQTQDAPFKATSLRRYVNPKSLVGVDPFQSSACRLTITENFLIDHC